MATGDIKKIRGRHWPRACLWALAGILLFEAVNGIFDPYFYTLETKTGQAADFGLDGLRMKIKNETVQRPGPGFDVLILGDSYLMGGVDPLALEHQTGLTAFNLSAFGDYGVFGGYCLLKNYLLNHPPPRYLVLGYQWDTLSRKAVEPSFMYELRQGHFKELAGEFGWAQALKYQIPSLKHQSFFRLLGQTGRIPAVAGREQAERLTLETIQSHGYYAPHAAEDAGEPVGEADYNERYRGFVVSSGSREYLHRIMNLARDKGIQVVYLQPTLSRDWYRLYAEHGGWEGYTRFTDRLCRTFPGTHLLRLQDQIQDRALYADRLHLNASGAKVLTKAVADFLTGPDPVLSP